jgi:Sulfotransferase family
MQRHLPRIVERLPQSLHGIHQRLSKHLLAIRYHRFRRKLSIEALESYAKLEGLSYPDFIIIGAPKCGTSWLQGVLAQHPNVVMVPEEIEYFSNHLERYPLEWYLDHFRQSLALASAKKMVTVSIGEKSARYCAISPDRIRLVHGVLPRARLILMTRDPVARHWSHAKRYFSKRRINKEGSVLSVPRSRLFEFLTSTRPLSEFSTMIANWTAVYAPEQLLIVSQERTLEQPRETYDAVLEHIGLPRDYDPDCISFLSSRKNRGPKVEMPQEVAQFLETVFASERKHLQSLLGGHAFIRLGQGGTS